MSKQKNDFESFLEKKFTPQEIATIHRQAEFEAIYLRQIQTIVSKTLNEYIQNNNATVDDIVEILGWSKSKIEKLKNGSYNLSVPDLGFLLSRLERDPKEFFKIVN